MITISALSDHIERGLEQIGMLNDTIIEDAGGYSYLAAVLGFIGKPGIEL